jgi:regulatory protein
MQKRLEKEEFPPETIRQVIEEIAALGYLNDKEFTERWIEDRADRKGYGKKRLAAELARKGIEKSEIQDAISHIAADDELNRAVAAAEKKLPAEQLAGLSFEARRESERKLSAFLQRRGFTYEIVRQVLQQRMQK